MKTLNNVASFFWNSSHAMRIVKMTEKMTEFDFVRWPNAIAETCKMTEFERTVLTEIKVYSPLDLYRWEFPVKFFGMAVMPFLCRDPFLHQNIQ